MMYLKIPNYPQEFIDAYVKSMMSKYINKIDRIDVKSKKTKKAKKVKKVKKVIKRMKVILNTELKEVIC